MLISSINKFFEKHGRVTYLVILIVIILSFVFFYGNSGSSLRGISARNPKIGEVFGRSINKKIFIHHIKAIKIKYYVEFQRYIGANDDQFVSGGIRH